MKKFLGAMTFLIALGAFATPAMAGPQRDVAVSIQGPGTGVYEEVVSVDFTINNDSNRQARKVKLSVDLPSGGEVAAVPAGCSVNGGELACNVGTMSKGASATIHLDYVLASSAGTASFDASVTHRHIAADLNPANNDAQHDISVVQPSIAIQHGDLMHGEACYGSGPLVFQDCINAPGSILTGDIIFHGDGTLDLGNSGFHGFWSQSSSSELHMDIYNSLDNSLATVWDGETISAHCFEGTNNPSTPGWVGAWRGCF